MGTEEYDNSLTERLVTLMNQKGYRGNFSMDKLSGMQAVVNGSLKECLERFLKAYYGSEKSAPVFELETKGSDHNIRCTFKMEFGEVSGFKIRQVEIENTETGEKQHRRLDNNQHVPGSVAVGTFFHKPKPWDNLLKGKFRM